MIASLKNVLAAFRTPVFNVAILQVHGQQKSLELIN